jgi:Cytochrome P460
MVAFLVVMYDILLQRSPQRRFSKQDPPRQTFFFDRPHPAFRVRVQIRASCWQSKRFKGYEDWSVVSSARTDEVLKVIVANPAMINAYKVCIPGNSQPFPEGSMIVKLQWKPKKSTEAPFAVDMPDVFKQVFVMEKDSKRFPKTGVWGYAVFNYDAASDRFTADEKSLADWGHSCHVAVKANDYIFHPYQKH